MSDENQTEMAVAPETDEQRCQRESLDSRIQNRLMAEGRPYEKEDDNNNIHVMGRDFSMKWILYYAQARFAGISCMKTSNHYAIRQSATDSSERYLMKAWYNVQDRALDHQLLYIAQKRMLEAGYFQKKPAVVAEPQPA